MTALLEEAAERCLVDESCPWRGSWRDALAHALAHDLPQPADREAWIGARRSFVGASEIPALVGVSPYASDLDVWIDKVQPLTRSDSDAMALGRLFERPLLDDYAERHGVVVRSSPTLRHRRFPHLAATPDGIASSGEAVQVKVVGPGVVDQWADGPPDYVRIQVQAELEVADLSRGVVLAVLGGVQRVEVTIERDRALGSDLVEIARQFWPLVERRDPPLQNATPKAIARLYPRVVRAGLEPAPDVVEEAVAAYAAAHAAATAADVIKATAADLIKASIADGEGFQLASGGRVTWKNSAGSTDWRGLAERLLANRPPRARQRWIDEFTAEFGPRRLDVRPEPPKSKTSKK